MNLQERHDSMRGWFSYELYQQMVRNPDIWLVCIDLGFKTFDQHFRDFPERCINTGASEAAATGLAVGLALEGKVPYIYTITSFYLRAAETIGLYLHGEQIPVKLVGSGLFQDYHIDGPSHDGTLTQEFLKPLNILKFYPQKKEDVPAYMETILKNGKPCFLGLRR